MYTQEGITDMKARIFAFALYFAASEVALVVVINYERIDRFIQICPFI